MPRPTSAFFSSLFNINSGKHSDKHSSSNSNIHSSDSDSGGQKRKKIETSDSSNGKKRRRGSVFLTPPTVNPRESSLYRHSHYSTTLVTDHDTFDPHHHHHSNNNTHPYASWPPRYPSTTDLYNLEFNPSTYFPAPPLRTSDPIDKRHTAIWDDLFDWAESYQSSADSSRATSPGSEGPYTSSRLRCSTQIDLNETVAEQKKKNRSSGLFSLARLGMKSEIWSKKDTFDMAATTEPTLPIIPPRSRLRAQAPPPINSRSTSYLLPVDEPLYASPQTPALSPGPSSQGSPNQLLVSPASDLPSLGRNKKKSYAGLGQDPMKIRDGALPRRSSSGVYTPPTFPGAQGPSPSHYPTHVYTPPGFSLGQPRPTPSKYTYAPAGPSRSASVSSADSEGPTTPGSNPGRLSSFSGKALTGLKRLSHQVTSNVSPLPVKQPISARDSYFPSSIGTDVHRVYDSPNTPTTPRATSFGPAFATQSTNSLGLGVGLTESEGRTHGTSPKSAEMSETSTEMSNKSSPSTRTKRKPVPRMLDDQLAARMNGLRVEDVPHAL